MKKTIANNKERGGFQFIRSHNKERSKTIGSSRTLGKGLALRRELALGRRPLRTPKKQGGFDSSITTPRKGTTP